MSEEVITVNKSEYGEMVDAYLILNCLRACGIDNWDGYDYAVEMMEAEEE